MNEYSLPDVSPLTVFFTTIGIYVLFLLGFIVVPNFMSVLFSLNHDKQYQRVQLRQYHTPERSSEREFGFRKFECVEEEAIYEPMETVYEPVEVPKPRTDSSIIQDAVDALVTLGYKKTQAKKLVADACNDVVFTDAGELVKATMMRSNI